MRLATRVKVTPFSYYQRHVHARPRLMQCRNHVSTPLRQFLVLTEALSSRHLRPAYISSSSSSSSSLERFYCCLGDADHDDDRLDGRPEILSRWLSAHVHARRVCFTAVMWNVNRTVDRRRFVLSAFHSVRYFLTKLVVYELACAHILRSLVPAVNLRRTESWVRRYSLLGLPP